jgi:paraquat-inducible protein B
MVWIIPILAGLVAVGIALQRYLSEGPTIHIVFDAAEGIEAGKTPIKYKDVIIGQVTAVRLSPNYEKVVVRAKIAKHAAGLMVRDARFWVVSPRITMSGISGLNTLLSGNYIGFQAGKAEEAQTEFVGLHTAPVVTDQQGRVFVLNATDLGSLSIGSPIYYRRLPVGQVIGYALAPDGGSVEIKVFVEAPYDRYVLAGTRFWNASGFDISVAADGINVRTESVVALLVGGLSFDAPPFETQTSPAPANARFTLYQDRATAMKAPDPVARHFVVYFDEPLRNLSVGAPVTLLGLAAGEVTGVGVEIDPKKGDLRPRVTLTFYPERVLALASGGAALAQVDAQKRAAFVRRLVEERGLRAQLKSGSLVTGQLYVAFDFHPDAPKAKIDLTRQPVALPSVKSDLANIEAKVASILDKVNRLPLDAIAEDLRKDLASLDQTLQGVRKLVGNVDAQLVPEIKTAVEDFRRAVTTLDRAMKNADGAFLESNSALQQELRDALQEFTRAARSIRVLTDQIERQPSSVIGGKPKQTSGATQ